MISKLRLENFQGHVDSTINFKPGLNIIVGETNHGKTSIVRAISSVMSGSLPEKYINFNATKTTITMWVGKHVIVRSRTAKTNECTIDNEDYTTVGKGLSHLQNIFGQTSIKIGGSVKNICIQDQHSPLFFVKFNDTERQQLLDFWIDFSFLDKLEKQLKVDLRDINALMPKIESNISYISEQLKTSNATLEDLTKKYNRIKPLVDKLNEKFTLYSSQKDLANKMLTALNNLDNFSSKLSSLKPCPQKYLDKMALLSKLADFQSKWDATKKSYVLSGVTKDKKSRDQILFEQIEEKLKLLTELRDFKLKIDTSYRAKKSAMAKLDVAQANLLILEKEHEALHQSYDKCPLCGSIKEKTK